VVLHILSEGGQPVPSTLDFILTEAHYKLVSTYNVPRVALISEPFLLAIMIKFLFKQRNQLYVGISDRRPVKDSR
jgi:hypothetical protein